MRKLDLGFDSIRLRDSETILPFQGWFRMTSNKKEYSLAIFKNAKDRPQRNKLKIKQEGWVLDKKLFDPDGNWESSFYLWQVIA